MKPFFYILKISMTLLIVFLSAHHVHGADDRAIFWKINHQQSTAYLFGSIHLADRSFYPLRDKIINAFDQSETLVVEVDINAQSSLKIQRWLSERGHYSKGQTLQQHLSAKTYRQLSDYIAQQGMDIKSYQHLKPGLLITLLSSLKMMQLGLSPDYGLDMFFLQRAQQQQKQVLALETFEQQMSILIDIPDGDLLVQQSLSQMNNLHLHMAQLIDAWKTGNKQRLNHLIFEDELAKNPQFSPLYDRLFSQRNIAMSNKISSYLKQSGQYFVVVGAGHLVGQSSIINLLEQQGFKAERL